MAAKTIKDKQALTADGVKALSNAATTAVNAGKATATAAANNVKNLSVGSTGEDVAKLQRALGIEDDGIFGPQTQQAVINYQKKNGLAVDGIAGKDTQGKLYGSNSTLFGNNVPNAGAIGSAISGMVAAGVNTAKGAASSNNSNKTNTNTGTKTNTGTDKGAAKTEVPTTPTEPATPATPTTPTATPTTEFTYDPFTYDPYTADPYSKSQAVLDAEAILAQMNANKPGEWVDPYKDKYLGYLSEYENRDPFSYDFNSDALYNQYKDQYIQQGRMAMMDTMGQAAALTGGYGNSYAQTVGQQAYNQQLNQLNEIMPELYDRAYSRYNQEGQDLLNMYGLYQGLSEQDYAKYMGDVENYYRELDAARTYANDLYTQEYGEWQDKTQLGFDEWNANTQLAFDKWATETGIDFDTYQALQDQAYREGRDAVADEQWQKTFDYNAGQDAKAEVESKRVNEYNRLANLISSSGYVPTVKELDAAGMSEAEAKALKDAYAAESSKPPQYKDMDIAVVRKDFDRAETIEDVNTLANIYKAEGYNPETIKELALAARNRILGPAKPVQTPSKTGTGVYGGSGGGGGGVTRQEIK